MQRFIFFLSIGPGELYLYYHPSPGGGRIGPKEGLAAEGESLTSLTRNYNKGMSEKGLKIRFLPR